jgi:hypothetical protein
VISQYAVYPVLTISSNRGYLISIRRLQVVVLSVKYRFCKPIYCDRTGIVRAVVEKMSRLEETLVPAPSKFLEQ